MSAPENQAVYPLTPGQAGYNTYPPSNTQPPTNTEPPSATYPPTNVLPG